MKTLRIVAASLAFGTVIAASVPASAEEVTPSRPVRPNRPLLVAGAAIIAASYTPAVVVAATSGRSEDKWLYVPVAGPWVDLAERGGCAPGGCGNEGLYKALLVTTGVAHLIGVGTVVASFIVPERSSAAAPEMSTKAIVVPATIGTNAYGLAVFKRF